MNAIQFFQWGGYQSDITISFADNANYSKFRNFSPRRVFFLADPVDGGSQIRFPVGLVNNSKENPYKWSLNFKVDLSEKYRNTNAILKGIEIKGDFDTSVKMTNYDSNAGIFVNKKKYYEANKSGFGKPSYSTLQVENRDTLKMYFYNYYGVYTFIKNLNNSLLEIVIPKVDD